MPRKERSFKTEVELCDAFIAALPKGWTNFNECCGWDILLVRTADGFQIGVEAKLKFTAKLLQQAIEESRWEATRPGPDCRAVLVPEGETDLGSIAAYVGVTVIQMRARTPVPYSISAPFLPQLPRTPGDRIHAEDWREWLPARRCKLPEYVPDVPAGTSAPVQLTDWKIKAIKLVILASRRGYVTRDDFRTLGLDHRRWISPGGWLRPTERKGWYVAEGSPPAGLRNQHPRVFAEIEADAEKWMPPQALVGADAARMRNAR